MTYLFLLFFGLSLFTWLSVRNFRAALLLFIALFPTYLLRFSLGPLPATFLEISFLILFSVWIVRGVRTKNLPRIPVILASVFFLVSLAALVVVPREHLISSLGLWRAYFLEPCLFGWLLWHELRDVSLRLSAFLSLALSAFVVAALGIFQWSLGVGIPAPWDIERRITSVFDYPNALGLFLAPVLSALLVFGILTWKQRLAHERRFIFGASIMMFLAIIFAKTEAALVAIPVAVLFALLLSPHFSRTQKIAATMLAGIVFSGALAVSPLREKILLQDFSGGVRRSQWKETVELLKDHPLTGAGIGYYPELLRAQYHHDWQYEVFQYPHNVLLNVWVELGILGVACGAWGAMLLGKLVWKQRGDALVLASGAAILVMLIHGLVDVPFFKNDLAMMTVMFVVLSIGKK